MSGWVDEWMRKGTNPYAHKLIYAFTHIRNKGGAKMEMEAELSRIIINEMSDQQVIVIKERHGTRSFPIVIGIVEIFAIDRRLKGIKPPRPMTHDLLANIIENLGARIEKIVINDLRHHTFFAKIHLSMNGRTIEVDSRPSDAIALGAASNAPIYVAEHVFEQTSQ
jgi:bifunctional DNase/RNase